MSEGADILTTDPAANARGLVARIVGTVTVDGIIVDGDITIGNLTAPVAGPQTLVEFVGLQHDVATPIYAANETAQGTYIYNDSPLPAYFKWSDDESVSSESFHFIVPSKGEKWLTAEFAGQPLEYAFATASELPSTVIRVCRTVSP